MKHCVVGSAANPEGSSFHPLVNEAGEPLAALDISVDVMHTSSKCMLGYALEGRLAGTPQIRPCLKNA
jgi:hypothetical protein